MVLVSRPTVGAVAFDRMLRDAVVAAVAPGHARPLDIPESARDRAAALREAVPRHTVVSGAAGLWVRLGGTFPPAVTAVGAHGLHRWKPGARPGGMTVRFHTGRAAAEPVDTLAGVRVAGAARCCADALRWCDLADAIPRVMRALSAGAADAREVGALVAAENPRGFGAARQRSAWAATAGAWRR